MLDCDKRFFFLQRGVEGRKPRLIKICNEFHECVDISNVLRAIFTDVKTCIPVDS